MVDDESRQGGRGEKVYVQPRSDGISVTDSDNKLLGIVNTAYKLESTESYHVVRGKIGKSGQRVGVRTSSGEGYIDASSIWLVGEQPEELIEEQANSFQHQPHTRSATESLADRGRAIYGNPFFDVGFLFDSWSDLIEGEAEKSGEFESAYREVVSKRKIPGVLPEPRSLSAPGVWAMSRQFHVVQRDIVTGAVYIATLGTDLYVSWRVFGKAKISPVKVLLWLALCFVMALPLSLEVDRWGEATINGGRLFGGYIGVLVFTGLWIAAYGFIRLYGDFLGLLREDLNELQFDDISAIAHVMHKSVLAAADKVGIDSTKLAVREPPFRNRQRRL